MRARHGALGGAGLARRIAHGFVRGLGSSLRRLNGVALRLVRGLRGVEPVLRDARVARRGLGVNRRGLQRGLRFALGLLESQHVLVVPGSSFNVPYRDHFRMTLLPEEEVMAEVFARIETYLDGGAARTG